MSMLNEILDKGANKPMKNISDSSKSRKRGKNIGKCDHSGVKKTEMKIKQK